MTFEQIIKELHAGKYHPVYFLHGEEPYFIDYISDFIEEKALTEAEKSFDQMVVYGRDVNKETIVGLAKGFPMIAKYRVVLIKEAQSVNNLISSKSKTSKTNNENLLERYLEHPSTSTILVFCYKYKTLDKRTSLYKSLEKHAVIFESKKLQDYKVADWISDYVKNHGYHINQASTSLLAEYLGNDLSKISNEIQKLFIGLSKGDAINDDIIEQNIGISKDYNVFELQNAIGSRDLLKVNKIIHYYESNPKDNPIQMIIPILFKYFAKLLVYHRLKDKSRSSVASELGINPFFVNDYVNASKHYSQGKIINNIHFLREYDMKSKGYGATGNMSDSDFYKELIFKLMY